MKYLNISSVTYENLLHKTGKLYTGDRDYMNTARLLCYCITKSLSTPYIWGLMYNMQKPNFNLFEAIKYIWEDFKHINFDSSHEEHYYPLLKTKRKVFINLDFMFGNDFKSYHRSGWAYVVGGMMNLDAHQLLRDSDIMVDTYLDRSFHWGNDTLETFGLIPYTQKWIGFIHHTYDTTHSVYNCVELFEKKTFLESLKYCKGLIALTEYLAKDLRISLIKKNFSHIPVFVLYHPMETVEDLFTLENFNSNNKKKIVQIGAWLRNPYSIYELPLWKNKLKLQKVALKGKDMDMYFKPDNFMDNLKIFLFKICISPGEICRPDICRPECMPDICRCCSNHVNKYCAGLYKHIEEQDKSVEILDRINNDDYDKLLSHNIIFLNLVDCSAVNTVLECLVRNTPIIINRHPAVEEILGDTYPGYYDDMIDASLLLNDIKKIEAMHNHLKKLNKRRYSLDYFMNKLQNIILNIS
jgi:hypothetical protein